MAADAPHQGEGPKRSGCVVLVCGGRQWRNQAYTTMTLNYVHRRFGVAVIVHGGAVGADECADRWAAARNIERRVYPADWNTHGRAAGPIRNQAMLDAERPDLVVAFPGMRGTQDMIARARKARINLIIVGNEELTEVFHERA